MEAPTRGLRLTLGAICLVSVLSAGIESVVLAQEQGPLEDYTETIPGMDVSFRMVALPGTDPKVWISQTEVTWDEYELFYFGGADEESTPEVKQRVDAVSRPTPPYGAPDQGWGTGRRPALTMTLYAAHKYCEWLSALTGKTYRLPAQQEWRLACESGSVEEPQLDRIAWSRGNTRRMTMEVGTREPNSWGLHDLLGNVAEFVAPPVEAPRDPGPRSIPAMGGSYRSRAGELSCSQPQIVSEEECLETDPQDPKSKWWYSDCFHIGFRVVRSES